MLTEVTEWPTVTQSSSRNGCGQRTFSHLLDVTCEHLPSCNIVWCQNGTQKFLTCLHAKHNWKCWKVTIFPWRCEQTSLVEKKMYSAWSKLQQSLVNSVYQSDLLWCICSAQGVQSTVQAKCKECDVGLYTGECYEVYQKSTKCDMLRSLGKLWNNKTSQQIGFYASVLKHTKPAYMAVS